MRCGVLCGNCAARPAARFPAAGKRCETLRNGCRDRRAPLCDTASMHSSFVAELSARRHALKHAWERKLRSEPVTSPLANPDTLVLLIDRTLDEFFAELARRTAETAPRPRVTRGAHDGCLCGLNPLLAYFRVGAATVANLSHTGLTECPELDVGEFERCQQEALGVFQQIARRELRSFCDMCQTEVARGARPLLPWHQAQAPAAGR